MQANNSSAQQFTFVVQVNCETKEQAFEVIANRLGCDEEYGFNYDVDWTYIDVESIKNEQSEGWDNDEEN